MSGVSNPIKYLPFNHVITVNLFHILTMCILEMLKQHDSLGV